MRKGLLFCLLVLLASWSFAQDGEQSIKRWSEVPALSQYTVALHTIDARCYSSGVIEFAILGSNGQPIGPDVLATLSLSNFRISYRGTVMDTTTHYYEFDYNGGWASVNDMSAGSYAIGFECLYTYPNGMPVLVVDSAYLDIQNLFVEPTIGVSTTSFASNGHVGNLPTLDCANTGRIELHIDGGQQPYHVVVYPHNNVTTPLCDTMLNHTDMDPNDPYRKFFAFTNMPAGEWDFYLTDSCGYGKPPISQVVDEVSSPTLDYVELYASSGHTTDSNVVKILAQMTPGNPYYLSLFAPYMQYRFIVPGLQEEAYTAWHSFPYVGNNPVLLVDSVVRADRYCDLWDRDIILQVKLNDNGICPAYTVSDTFQYHKPAQNRFIPETGFVVDSVSAQSGCAGSTKFGHVDDYTIRYYENYPNQVTVEQDHAIRRYHFTYPIVWRYRDPSNTLIKTDTIWSDISKKSMLSFSDFLAIDPTLTRPFSSPMTIGLELVDANGCQLYSGSRNVRFENRIQSTNGPRWSSSKKDPECCSELRTIRIFEEFGISDLLDYDQLTIALTSSPNNDFYNFTAVFDAHLRVWTVTKARIDNWATVEGASNGTSLVFSDYCLPSGTYTFTVTNAPCVGTATVKVYLKGLVKAEIVEEPHYEVVKECASEYIKCTAGKVAKVTTTRPQNNNSVINRDTVVLPTRFKIMDGPMGGFDASDIEEHNIGDSIRVSIPADSLHPYVIVIYPDTTNVNICGSFSHFDSLYFQDLPLKFDFSLALMCDATSDTGTAYLMAYDGHPPYSYKLYTEPNLQGTFVGEQIKNAGEVAVYDTLPMHLNTEFSCLVSDACGTSFMLSFRPQTLADLQKIWFEGGLKVISTCEGSIIQAHALRIGNILTYRWYKNGVFFSESSEPEIFIPRGADTAVYRVEIYQTGCQEMVADSVTVYPLKSPSLHISPIPEICPGEEVEVKFVPKAAVGDTVLFRVAFANQEGIEIREYVGVNGDTVRDTYMTHSAAKIYPLNIQDVRCGYIYADHDDTAFVNISNHLIDPCTVLTWYDTVCYMNDAHLAAGCTAAGDGDPITLRWYSDFSMTDLIQEKILLDDRDTSVLTIPELTEWAIRFVSVEKENWCPSNNLIYNNSINLTADAETHMNCTDAYMFYDDGGADHGYSAGETVGTISHLFVCDVPGHPVCIHFNDLELSNTSHLLFFSGHDPLVDSLILELNSGSVIPDVVASNSSEMLVYFIPGQESEAGWSAIVKPAPGIAVADIYRHSYRLYRDTVCQSQTKLYADPHHFATNDPVLMDDLNKAVKKSRYYLFERTYQDVHGCDSTEALSLWVIPPPYTKTDVVILNLDAPYHWNGEDYYETGQYVKYWQPDGECDSADILNLIVLVVDTSTNEICIGEETDMGVYVTTPPMDYIFARPAIGDVLCTDGDILHPDSFLNSGKTAMGVVFYIDPSDPTHMTGRAVALYDAHVGNLGWAGNRVFKYVHSQQVYSDMDHHGAMAEMDGYGNTLQIQATALAAEGGDFKENAPAAYYCWYYDHTIHGTGSVNKSWYLPALGELNILFANRFIVNKTLQLLADHGLATLMLDNNPNSNYSDTKYWSSTEYADDAAYCISAKGQLNKNNGKTLNTKNYRYVRAVRTFPN